jgi:hypothetical protein
MAGLNCWEFKRCGREVGGARTGELGVCQANVEARADGANGGRNGGRVCWAIAGTLCGGKVQGTFASKSATCMDCEFYRTVAGEEGGGFASVREVLARLRAS